ncbi:hypothetical protein CAPTEDRAFT_191776 [Capitella teleta]|uniref:Uncharacterized protein n=1 Tax=Capitella teleta TaxID=283909 RepID=R7TIG6_CAPTE|nr:hypothetical protein CAPTEDRAFT_191776 [Capitella teleta]|eukprot:ELT93638.1 hypothetical protein CAPTEDRAFT_191776 [Capitella teleta]
MAAYCVATILLSLLAGGVVSPIMRRQLINRVGAEWILYVIQINERLTHVWSHRCLPANNCTDSISVPGVSATRCYSCQYTHNINRVGGECVDQPDDYSLGPTTVECPGACQTEKQVTEATKDVYFMRRGCAVRPVGCQTDMHGFRTTCIQSCDGDLCRTETAGKPTNKTKPKNLEYGKIKNAEGVIRSFYRGCEPRRGRKDECVESVPFSDCNYFCEGDLCNHGNGLDSTPSMVGEVVGTTKAITVAPIAARTTRRTRRLRPTLRAAGKKLRSSGNSGQDTSSAFVCLVVMGYVAMF